MAARRHEVNETVLVKSPEGGEARPASPSAIPDGVSLLHGYEVVHDQAILAKNSILIRRRADHQHAEDCGEVNE